MVCHNYRRIPAVALAKRMIERGDLGDRIYHYRARYAQEWIMDPEFPLVWRLQADIAGSAARTATSTRTSSTSAAIWSAIIKEVCGTDGDIHQGTPRPERRGRGSHRAGGPAERQGHRGRCRELDRSFPERRALANLEATRFAAGRKNHITFEINGSKGTLTFNFEDMNRLGFYKRRRPFGRAGFPRHSSSRKAEHPFVGAWWPAGHIIGYEHTFVHTFADFVRAVDGRQERAADLRRRTGERASAQRDYGERPDPAVGDALRPLGREGGR